MIAPIMKKIAKLNTKKIIKFIVEGSVYKLIFIVIYLSGKTATSNKSNPKIWTKCEG